MVLIGETNIGFDDENNLVYLGNKRNSGTELIHENANEVFFDNKNVPNIADITTNNNNVELINTASFINGANFYTCNANAQTYLCFRCFNSCVSCVSCATCDACNTCTNCTSNCHTGCDSTCFDECQTCVNCTTCNNCQRCDGCYKHGNIK